MERLLEVPRVQEDEGGNEHPGGMEGIAQRAIYIKTMAVVLIQKHWNTSTGRELVWRVCAKRKRKKALLTW